MVGNTRRSRVRAQHAKTSVKNAEEIALSSDEDEPSSSGPIDNAHDVHVIAKALGNSNSAPAAAVAMVAATPAIPKELGEDAKPGPSSSSSSSSEEDSDESSEEEIMDVSSYKDMKSLVDEMMGRSNGQDNGKDNRNGACHPQACQELFDTSESSLDALRASLRQLTVSASEQLVEAGTVITCLEGTLVVQATSGAACLAEGSVLLTASRQVIGPIEDIFGPIEAPMYVLMDPNKLFGEEGVRVAVGETVSFLPSMAKRIVEMESLKDVGVDEDVEIAGEDEDEEEEADQEAEEEAEEEAAEAEEAEVERRPQPAQQQQQTHHTQPSHQPKTIAEWQSQQQQQAKTAGSQKPLFKPVVFRREFGT